MKWKRRGDCQMITLSEQYIEWAGRRVPEFSVSAFAWTAPPLYVQAWSLK